MDEEAFQARWSMVRMPLAGILVWGEVGIFGLTFAPMDIPRGYPGVGGVRLS